MKTAKIAPIIALSALLVASPLALAGCEGGNMGSLQGAALGSQHSSNADRENWSTVQDTAGNEYSTVLSIIPIGNTSFDEKGFQEFLSKNNVNWYQMIAASNMGTSQQEKAYLYFPQSVTLSELESVRDMILAQGTYECAVFLPAEAQGYTDEAADRMNIYYNETTYFGPASKQ